jgi:hypothetical protein
MRLFAVGHGVVEGAQMAQSAQDASQTPPAGRRQLTAINTAKVLTIVLLLVLAALVGVKDMGQVVYLSLHISY